MQNTILTEDVKKSWEPILNESSLPEIKDATVRNTVMRLLENTKAELNEAATTIAADGTSTNGAADNYDPVLIKLIRRTMPSIIAHDIIGVQPMSGPTGLVFSMAAEYVDGGAEAFGVDAPVDQGKNTTTEAELLGADTEITAANNDGSGTAALPVTQVSPWKEMTFSIEKAPVDVQTRALKGTYTQELAQDLKAIHGIDAETELANILAGELTAEINREMIALIDNQAIITPVTDWRGGGAGTAPLGTELMTVGEFDLEADTDAIGEIDQIKALMLFLNNQSARIARGTRRGMANWIITSPSIAGALETAGKVDAIANFGAVSTPADVGVTYAGILNGRYKLFIDPYMATDIVYMGYKGASAYDAGAYYSPYVPMSLMKAVGENDFQPRIGFKTRYGLAVNPMAVAKGSRNNISISDATSAGNVGYHANPYFRKFTVLGL